MDWKKGGVILSLSLVFLLIGVLSANAEYCGDTYNEATYNGPLEVGCNTDSLCEWNAGTRICVSKSQPSVPVQPIVAPADTPSSLPEPSVQSCGDKYNPLTYNGPLEVGCNTDSLCEWDSDSNICIASTEKKPLPSEKQIPAEVSPPEKETATRQEVIFSSKLTATINTDGAVYLRWNAAEVNSLTAKIIYENQITGNVGFFDSITNFFKNLFGAGTRGALLTQQNLVYDVWRDGSVIQTGIKCTSSCSYTDTTAQQGKDYTYKVGARLSTTSSPSDDSVKFSDEVSINIPTPEVAPDVSQRPAQPIPSTISITSDKTVVEAGGFVATLIASSNSVTSFRWGILKENGATDQDCFIVYGSTGNAGEGPVVTNPVLIRGAKEGSCTIAVSDHSDPTNFVGTYTLQVTKAAAVQQTTAA